MIKQRADRLEHQITIDADPLISASRRFFQSSGARYFLGDDFFNALGLPAKTHSRPDLFETMVEACGHQDDVAGFFTALLERVLVSRDRPVRVNQVTIPVLYLYEVLKVIFPGEELHRIRTVAQLEHLLQGPFTDAAVSQKILDRFPVRLSDHVIRQSMVSAGVARQYLPFSEECDDIGAAITFDGHFKNGLLEQMYQDRVVFLLDMRCPVYCRFCFRKHKSSRNQAPPDLKDVHHAVDHVRAHPSIREVLITGGEPLLNRQNFNAAMDGLVEVDHVETIRIATRTLVYYPHFFYANDSANLMALIDQGKRCRAKGKQLEAGIHLVHPDEISVETIRLIACLVQNGIRVYLQTPFLNHVNNDADVLARLFIRMRQAGAQIYYIFAPCSPIYGTRPYWAPIHQAIGAVQTLRQTLSDRSIPKLCTATPLGKIEWHSSGWAVETDKQDPSFTWIRTPYTRSYFEQFLSGSSSLPEFRVNDEGTLDAKFRVDMGQTRLLLGNRPSGKNRNQPAPLFNRQKQIKAIRRELNRQGIIRKIGQTTEGMARFLPACLEVGPRQAEDAVVFLKQAASVTDVVIHADADACQAVIDKIRQFKRIEALTCARICMKNPKTVAEQLSERIIKALSDLQSFSLVRPFRIEIETWVLSHDEICPELARTAGDLLKSGINIYANSALFTGVNDRPGEMALLARSLRTAGVEFHQVYVDGLFIQKRLNPHPVDYQALIDIAGRLRTDCSGRQVPLYVVQTSTGISDYDLSGRFKEKASTA